MFWQPKTEEANIGKCLESVKGLADEIIVFDEASTDKTVEIAKKYNAKVTNYVNKTNFHETKQKAIEELQEIGYCNWMQMSV